MRILLLGATFETENLGVRALAVGAVRCILARYPEATISLLDYSRESAVYPVQLEDRVVSIPLVNLRFSIRFYLSNNIALLIAWMLLLRLIPWPPLRTRLISENSTLRRLSCADLAFSVAGGDSFSDIYGLRRFFYVTLPQMLVLLMNKKLILLPQTYGPFRYRLSRFIARNVVRRADRVYARDRHSLSTVQELMGTTLAAARARFSYDVAFALPSTKPRHLKISGLDLYSSSGDLVGINISGLLSRGGYTYNNSFGFGVDYGQLMRSLIDCLVVKHRVKVLLVPHVLGLSSDGESDVPASNILFEELRHSYSGRIGIILGDYDQSEAKYVIGLCDFFIGARMHSCIAAVSQSVPAVCIAYSDKFAGLMKTIGIEDSVADPRWMNEEEILAVVEDAYSRRTAIRENLTNRMVDVKAATLKFLQGSAAISATGIASECNATTGGDTDSRCRCTS